MCDHLHLTLGPKGALLPESKESVAPLPACGIRAFLVSPAEGPASLRQFPAASHGPVAFPTGSVAAILKLPAQELVKGSPVDWGQKLTF